MNLGALFSGGKDSAFSIYEALRQGHSIKCLITILTNSAESHLLHHPNIELTKLQAKCLNLSQVLVQSTHDDITKELELIKKTLSIAKRDYLIDGIVHGGILSEFQKTNFESVAASLNLQTISPIWHKDQKQYMKNLVESNFEFIITAVCCDGLDDFWLGKKITRDNVDSLISKADKYKFNPSFEGGEAETFVVNCPLFSSSIQIRSYEKHWDGYRGRFEITEAKILGNA